MFYEMNNKTFFNKKQNVLSSFESGRKLDLNAPIRFNLTHSYAFLSSIY